MHAAGSESSHLSTVDLLPIGRKTYRLTTEQWLDRPLAYVFAFFTDAFNLERITPPWLRFKVLTPPPLAMYVGMRIDYRMHIHGVPITWQSEITDWDPPYRFVDQQRRGPYKQWIHEHVFIARGRRTLVRDRVDYRVPGPALVNRILVSPDLRKIFAYRHERLRELLAPEPAAENSSE